MERSTRFPWLALCQGKEIRVKAQQITLLEAYFFEEPAGALLPLSGLATSQKPQPMDDPAQRSILDSSILHGLRWQIGGLRRFASQPLALGSIWALSTWLNRSSSPGGEFWRFEAGR